jgi:hypothetical protein
MDTHPRQQPYASSRTAVPLVVFVSQLLSHPHQATSRDFSAKGSLPTKGYLYLANLLS